jgi:hypothetical protein
MPGTPCGAAAEAPRGLATRSRPRAWPAACATPGRARRLRMPWRAAARRVPGAGRIHVNRARAARRLASHPRPLSPPPPPARSPSPSDHSPREYHAGEGAFRWEGLHNDLPALLKAQARDNAVAAVVFNRGFAPIALNCIVSLVRFGRAHNYVVAAVGESSVAGCLALRLPCFNATGLLEKPPDGDAGRNTREWFNLVRGEGLCPCACMCGVRVRVCAGVQACCVFAVCMCMCASKRARARAVHTLILLACVSGQAGGGGARGGLEPRSITAAPAPPPAPAPAPQKVWAKTLVTDAVFELGYDVLFFDADVVWLKEALPNYRRFLEKYDADGTFMAVRGRSRRGSCRGFVGAFCVLWVVRGGDG